MRRFMSQCNMKKVHPVPRSETSIGWRLVSTIADGFAAMYIDPSLASRELEEESPIRGMSAPLYQLLLEKYSEKPLSKSPVGGLSLPEYERLCGKAD